MFTYLLGHKATLNHPTSSGRSPLGLLRLSMVFFCVWAWSSAFEHGLLLHFSMVFFCIWAWSSSAFEHGLLLRLSMVFFCVWAWSSSAFEHGLLLHLSMVFFCVLAWSSSAFENGLLLRLSMVRTKELCKQEGGTEVSFPTPPSLVNCWLKCCFTSTETVGLLGTGAQDGHLDFHTAPELWVWLSWGDLFIVLFLF